MREVCRVLAALLAALVFAYSFTLAGASNVLTSLCLFTVPVVVAGLTLVSERLLTLATAALAGQYLGGLHFGEVEVDIAVPLVAAVIVLFAEVGDLALSVPPGTALDRSFVRARLTALAGTVTVAAAAAAGVLALSSIGLGGSTAGRSIGLAGAAVAVAAPLVWLRSRAAGEAS